MGKPDSCLAGRRPSAAWWCTGSRSCDPEGLGPRKASEVGLSFGFRVLGFRASGSWGLKGFRV